MTETNHETTQAVGGASHGPSYPARPAPLVQARREERRRGFEFGAGYGFGIGLAGGVLVGAVLWAPWMVAP